VKTTERNLESKQCVDVAGEDNSLPPIRTASQQNHAYKVTTLCCVVLKSLPLYGSTIHRLHWSKVSSCVLFTKHLGQIVCTSVFRCNI